MRKRRLRLVAGAGVVVILALAVSLFVASSLGQPQPAQTPRPVPTASSSSMPAPVSVAAGDNEVITTVQQRFPSAQLIIVGPAAIVANTNADKTRIDDTLRRISSERSLNYISPLREKWFPAGKDSPYVNWDVGHPNNAGYSLYAGRLRDDIAALSAPS